MRPAAGWSSSCRHGSALPPPPPPPLLLLLLLLLSASSAQAQKAPRTDPVEANALDAVFTKLNVWPMPPWWSSEDPCVGAATEGASMSNPGIKCDCSDQNSTVCHIVELNLGQNYLTGPLPSFLGELIAMKYMTLAINALSGSVPKELGNLTNLISLSFATNNLNGSLPSELGNLVKLEQLCINKKFWAPDHLSLPPRARFDYQVPCLMYYICVHILCRWASDNDFAGQIPDFIGTWANLTDLRFQGNSFQGPIPTTISKLVQLTNLRIGDIRNGSSSLVFISNMTYLETLVLRNCMISDSLESVNFSQFANLNILDLSFNNITGQVPQSLTNLNSLNFLFFGNNSLSGSLPRSIGPSLTSLDFSYNQLSGNFPSWASQNLQLNLVANNFMIDNSNNSVLPSGLRCLQRNTPCFLGSPQSSSFAVACGSSKSISASDNTSYQPDDAKLGSASYYVREAPPTWGVSNVGRFMDAPNESYTIYSSDGSYTIYSSSRQFRNTQDSELFQKARMSPSSLRYFGVRLENGNYIVTLQFAEFVFEDSQTWKSLGKRVFDIYIQGEQKEQNFNIKKAARGSYGAVQKEYIVPVTRNFLEIHLFWAGKGTCCIPSQGYYGPSVSALSATLVRKKNKSKIGVIVGVVVGTIFIGLVLAGLHVWKQKSRKLLLKQQGIYNIIGRPNVLSYSYGELKTAVQNFSSTNLLGEGGYGSVYKVWQLYEEDHPLDIADRSLTEFNEEEVLRAIRVGLLCIQSSPRQHPPMSRVVSMLAGNIEVAEALTKPSYVTEWQDELGAHGGGCVVYGAVHKFHHR